MLHRYYPRVGLLAVGGWLLAGCVAAPASKQSNTAGDASAPVEAPVVAETPVDQKTVEAHAHYAQALIYDLADDQDAALKEFSMASAGDPGNEQLALDLSRRFLQRNHPEQALEVLQRAAALPKASGLIYGRLAQIYVVLGKDDQAIAASQTAIKRAPLAIGGYLNLFLIHLKKGHAAEALTVLDQAAKQPDAPVEFLIGLAELYGNLEHQAPSQKEAAKPGAKAVVERAAKLNPSSPYLRLKLAEDFSQLGDNKSATQIYLQLLDQNPDLPALRDEVRAKLAFIYLRSSDPQKAAEQLEAIVKDDPSNAQAYYYLGALAVEAKKYPEAADYFEKTLVLNDNFGEAEQTYYTLAGLQIQLNRVKEAFATLQKSQARFHDNFRTEFLTAAAYNKEKDFTNAILHLTSAELMARASDPSRLNEDFYFQVGATYERAGDFAQAAEAFAKALKLQPDFAEALNYYGYMLAERGQELERAREMIEKAVKLEPKNAAFLDSLAWVFYKSNQPAEALPPILKAIELSEEPDATLEDHLGDIYAALKQQDKAKEAWRKSLELEKNEQIQKKLDAPPS